MYIPSLLTGGFYLVILFFSVTINAEIYKWTDDNAQVHYSETAPDDHQTEVIPPPPPPVEDPATAQKRVDALIKSQNQQIEDLNTAKIAAAEAQYDERSRRARYDLLRFIASSTQVYRGSRNVIVVHPRHHGVSHHGLPSTPPAPTPNHRGLRPQ